MCMSGVQAAYFVWAGNVTRGEPAKSDAVVCRAEHASVAAPRKRCSISQ